MSEFKSLLIVLILNLWTVTTADVEISCVLAESCILPCSFQPGTDPLIHWIKEDAGNIYAHSYYSARDQLQYQSELFKGRTSLFPEQISRGNASLRMTGLQLQDQGRYKCYTSIIDGNKIESFIKLSAEAPVRRVHIEQVQNNLTCSSEGIYPEPELTWSTSPPSNLTLQREPTVRQTQQQLYDISSSLTLSADTDVVCTVSTGSGRRRVTWHQPTPVHVSHGETTTINCAAPNIKAPTRLVWKFNHTQVLVNWSQVDGPPRVSEQWKQQVEDVSESGSLTLHHLSPDHQGTFTCELSDEEETHLINSDVTIETQTVPVAAIVVPVLAVVIILALGAGFFCKRLKNKLRKNSTTVHIPLSKQNKENNEDSKKEKTELLPEVEKDKQIPHDEEEESNMLKKADSRATDEQG